MISKYLCLFLCVSILTSCNKDTGSTEKLLAKPPNGWKTIYQINNVDTRLTDFIPESEDEINWVSKVSFESFRNFDDADPIEVTLGEVEKDKEICNFVQHFNLFSGLENNYPTSLRLYMCGKQSITEKGMVKLIKAIKADDYFYIVRLTKKLRPFTVNKAEIDKGEIAAWSKYLKMMRVCNDKQPKHACPASDQE